VQALLPPPPRLTPLPSAIPADAVFADHPGTEIRVPSFDVRPLVRAYDEIKNLGSKVYDEIKNLGSKVLRRELQLD
jgi:hypothetical protein